MISNIPKSNDLTRFSFIIAQGLDRENLICAEIGTWIGLNAENMLNLDPTMKLYCVDGYTNIGITDDYSEGKPEEVKAKAKERLSKFGDRVQFVYKQSEEAYLDFPSEFFDYIYIDAGHDYFNVYRDMKTWWPKLKKGGVFGGHDISMGSVSKALVDFGDDNMLLGKIKKIEGGGKSDWWVVK